MNDKATASHNEEFPSRELWRGKFPWSGNSQKQSREHKLTTMKSFHQGNSEEDSSHDMGTHMWGQRPFSADRGILSQTARGNSLRIRLSRFIQRSDWFKKLTQFKPKSHVKKVQLGHQAKGILDTNERCDCPRQMDYKAKWIVLGLSTSPRTYKHPHQRKERKGREVPAGECVISTTVKLKFPGARELRSQRKVWVTCVLLLWA